MASKLAKKALVILDPAFPGIRFDYFKKPRGCKTTRGILIWQGFETMEQMKRQTVVRRRLRAGLSKEEYESISLIITLTTDEVRSINAG